MVAQQGQSVLLPKTAPHRAGDQRMQLITESSAMGLMNLARLLDLQDEHAGRPTPDAALPGSQDLQDRTPTFSRAEGLGSSGII